MKIVHIEDFFHPDAGYQINILSKYLKSLGNEVTIVTSEMDKIPEALTSFFGCENIEQRDAEYEKNYGVKIIRLPLKAFVSGRAVFKRGLLKVIKACNPDILYVHGNDTFTGMWALLNRKKYGCPLIMDSHMLEMASKNKFRKLYRWVYRTIFTPIIVKNKIQVIRTQDDPYVEKDLGIPLLQAPWISYGSDTMLFHPDQGCKKRFRTEQGISDDALIVVYAGKLIESKGGKLLAETFAKKFPVDREIVLAAVGNTSGDYGNEVEDIFQKSENRIIRFPTQKYQDLAYYFQIADLAVFPKQCSLSFYDVQACGLPVLSEDNNINIDRCSHQNGWTFRNGNMEDFREKIIEIANMDETEYKKVSENAYRYILDNYNYEDKAREYEAVIKAAYDDFKERIK